MGPIADLEITSDQPSRSAGLFVSNVRFAAHYGPNSNIELGPKSADIVAKVFLGGRTKFLRAVDAFYERRREGPYRFIQNRPGTSIVALKSVTAAEESKDQLSRDFSGRSIFDFCNNICHEQKPC